MFGSHIFHKHWVYIKTENETFTLLHYSMEILLFSKHKRSSSDVRGEKVSELGVGWDHWPNVERLLCMNAPLKAQLRSAGSYFKVGFNGL